MKVWIFISQYSDRVEVYDSYAKALEVWLEYLDDVTDKGYLLPDWEDDFGNNFETCLKIGSFSLDDGSAEIYEREINVTQ